MLVSLGSWLMFPRSFISFGVLHGIAVMLIIVRLTASLGRVALAARRWSRSLLPQARRSDPFFDTRWTNWVGLVTRLPVTEDYAPVLPWLGVVWWGAAAADWLLAHRPLLLAGALPRAAASARRPRPLEPQLLHAAPAGADRALLWLVATISVDDDATSLFGFHAVGVRLKTRRARCIEVHVDAARRDQRMRQLRRSRRRRRRSGWSTATTSACAAWPATIRHQGVVAIVEAVARRHSLDDMLDAAEAAASAAASSSSTASPTRTTSAPACASPTVRARTP